MQVRPAPTSRPHGGLRFSGHETFALRCAWLPKAYRVLRRDPGAFADEDGAMVELGLGRNMVRSLRFWAEVAGVGLPERPSGLRPTAFADAVLGRDGFDPYLEDERTLWLLHWNIASRAEGALFAWRHLLGEWPHPEFTRSEALAAFARESARMGFGHSAVTLAQHLDVFLHTYCRSRASGAGVEDSLDSPLAELDLVTPAGERRGHGGRRETVYAFRREPKPEVTAELFDHCLSDYWARHRPGEGTLTLRDVALAPCSPGQVFKLPEDDVRARLERHASDRAGSTFHYRPSAVQGLLARRQGAPAPSLAGIYGQERVHA